MQRKTKSIPLYTFWAMVILLGPFKLEGSEAREDWYVSGPSLHGDRVACLTKMRVKTIIPVLKALAVKEKAPVEGLLKEFQDKHTDISLTKATLKNYVVKWRLLAPMDQGGSQLELNEYNLANEYNLLEVVLQFYDPFEEKGGAISKRDVASFNLPNYCSDYHMNSMPSDEELIELVHAKFFPTIQARVGQVILNEAAQLVNGCNDPIQDCRDKVTEAEVLQAVHSSSR